MESVALRLRLRPALALSSIFVFFGGSFGPSLQRQGASLAKGTNSINDAVGNGAIKFNPCAFVFRQRLVEQVAEIEWLADDNPYRAENTWNKFANTENFVCAYQTDGDDGWTCIIDEFADAGATASDFAGP